MITRPSDCTVLFVGECMETYRAVNQSLRSLGVSVMWAQNSEAARFLTRTVEIELIVCDAMETSDNKQFMSNPEVIMPGTRTLQMTLPKLSNDRTMTEQNILASLRLEHISKTLLLGHLQELAA